MYNITPNSFIANVQRFDVKANVMSLQNGNPVTHKARTDCAGTIDSILDDGISPLSMLEHMGSLRPQFVSERWSARTSPLYPASQLFQTVS